MKQGQPGNKCYFIIQGSCEVLMGAPEDAFYLDKKTMYNEHAVFKARHSNKLDKATIEMI